VELAHITKAEKAIELNLSGNGSVLENFPVENYISLIDRYPEIFDYKDVSPEAKDYCNQILERTDRNVLQLYHKLVILRFIKKSLQKLEHENLPQEVINLYHRHYKKIVADTFACSDDFYELSNDKFCKDFAISRMKMIPAGAVLIERARLPKKFLFRSGIKQFVEGAFFIASELKGLGPLYQSHLDTREGSISLAEFNPGGWIRSYLRIADILRANPEIKGNFGITWFNDPKMKEISPKLSYIREISVTNGGKIFYYGSSKAVIRDALSKSATRRRLYQEGSYVPRSFIRIWSRSKLIGWADRLKNHMG
jgi:hypothetical protein